MRVLCAILLLMGMMSNRVCADEPGALRVLSYNIHHGAGMDHRLDLERIAKVILSATPDLVFLQEVDLNLERTNHQDQPKELGQLTDMRVVFGANIRFGGGEYGNAVLSRFPIRTYVNHHLPRVGDSEQRGVIEAEIAIPGLADPLIVLATHLDHRPDERERLASVKVINQLIGKHGERPAILGGDLNDVPGSPPLVALEKTWKRANAEPLATVPVDHPKRQIDYVLYRPAKRWDVVRVDVLPEAEASDHRAILAVLKLRSLP